jgi:hypothetical protein
VEKFYLLQVMNVRSNPACQKLHQALTVLTLLLVATAFSGCKEEKQAPVTKREVRRIKGEVEVLNSCSMKGAAVKMRTFLRDNGFDVVHIDNERLQNYDETIIVLRNPEWEGAQALAATLKTKNVLVLLNKNATVDAIVHTGRDFQQIVEPDQGEKNDSK